MTACRGLSSYSLSTLPQETNDPTFATQNMTSDVPKIDSRRTDKKTLVRNHSAPPSRESEFVQLTTKKAGRTELHCEVRQLE
jgi:hypothetical protein